jgi:putative nucleotidyltransferase with HDIG domain
VEKNMKEKFRNVFSSILNRMEDKVLADKVIQVWVDCAVEGGWKSVEEIAEIPFTLLTETEGVNLIEHTIAVTKGALGIADAMISTYRKVPFDINIDWVIAGGILHDVGKLMEIEKVDGKYRKSYAGKCARHPISGAIAAAKAGLPMEIQNIIICHAKEGEGRPQRIEGVFIHQADFATFDPCVMKQKGLLIEKK